ncbi:rhomboid family intramembrane serine protease [Paractinoplanes atraurantiacus]|uniref:Membrane associated serine protease, rhomboid family n=1 Tax=Paractinoplanes atraurantiacus TaxID=1036182 RepID=A0A285JDG6_9ACTN|nr:rhomboid family intramembrane serine protease [Actinoplanes atraurantiacus]SNY58319.1 Membrane associated serine protease, rhomboid family [Actinoplanes atraurantiacus]
MSEAPSTVPVCYRHPSRETYIRCTRCDRPICPDCMNEASVGHQCPECVAEGKRSQRPARTAFGGSRAGTAGYVTRTLIGINVAVMALSAILGGATALAGNGGWFGLMGSETPLTRWGEVLGYAPYTLGGDPHGIAAGEWWRLVTAMFLHYGLLHLALNMWLLWQLGRYLEVQFGPLRFAAIYLLAGLGGNVAAYLFTPQNQPAAGASTAIFGLFLAMIVVNRRLKRDISQLIPLLVVNLIFTFAVPNVSIAGHLGGLVIGGAVAFVLAYAPMRNRSRIQLAGSAAVLVVLLIAAVVRTQMLLG